jgi:outer membrane protein
MLRNTLIVAGAVAAAAVAGAQEAAAPKAGQARMGVVDMERVTQESLLGKSYSAQIEALNNEIEAEGNKKRNELQKMEAEIKALTDDLEKQGALLSDEAAEKKRQEIVRKNRDREAYVEDGRGDLERMRQKAQNQAQALNAEFQSKIRPHIETVAKAQGVDILLDSRGWVLVINKAFDITNEVIVKVDDVERATKGAGAAKPPAKPAAVPARPTPAKP